MVQKLIDSTWKPFVCILAFLLISAAYFAPLISGKKVMFQHDIKQAVGMAHEIELHKEATGEQSLWTNSMFGGMPAYQIKADYPNNWSAYIFSTITYVFGYDRYPMTSLWLLMTCFFLMLLAFRVNIWAAAAVSVGYGFTTFNLIGIEAGHANKIWTLMYAPVILSGIRLALDKKWLAGGIITALGLAINVYANHLQITYYLFIAVMIWMIIELIFAIRENTLPVFFKAAGVLIVGALIGISTNASSLWTTYEYGNESTRGGSDLTIDEGASNSGLDKNYIFDDYSYGNIEVLTFLIPNFSGGASTMDVDKKSELAKTIQRNNDLPTYWGGQRYVAGPYYLGAILVFLMVVGIILSSRDKMKIWLIIAGLLALFLSMGKHFFLSDFFYNHFPLYNKFRTPTMITALTQIAIAGLAALGLHALWEKREDSRTLKGLNLSFYIVGGLCLLLALIGGSLFSFTNDMDEQIGIKDQVLQLFQEYRIDMMRKDALRSLVLIALAWAALWAAIKGKIQTGLAVGIVAFLMLGDQWMVNQRYMSDDTYKKKTKEENLYTQSNADKLIMADTELDFRVLNMTVSPFNDATTSYYHKSVGGYHGAKLRRYQELIEYGITPEMQGFQGVLQQQDLFLLDSSMRNMPVMNMLNTKYFIINPDGAPLKNTYANGNAWFVKEVKPVANADEEILGLKGFDSKTTALVDVSRWADQLGGFTGSSGAGEIKITSYSTNHLVYERNSTEEQLA
ncbi:MAG: hypothetical protein LPK45_09555, partial [Bacteroidota bacterium]|nr:hypothetical protein [Bacteroidota bacterium]MDX5431330.1 hypothetical protein [Bacteroidota bacterium]MDX5470068.1 hypothetical protein [Bacteroidota bacterium]